MAPVCRPTKHPTSIDVAERYSPARCLGLMGLLVALVVASQAGAGGLFPSRTFAAGDGTWSVAVADFDGDSVPDLVTANRDSADVSVLLGNGDGSFQAAVAFGAGSFPVSVAVADLDGDRVPDLVTANNGSSDVSVLFNQCDPPALSVDLDIKPGSDRNAINPSSRGVVPVAILGSEDFDVADIDEMALVFGSDEAPLAGAVLRRRNDLNADGFSDLLVRFRIDESGIEFGDTESCIQGRLVDGSIFSGCDAVQTVPDR